MVHVTVLVAGLKVPPFEGTTEMTPAGSGSVMVTGVIATSPVLFTVTWYWTGVSRANWAAGVTSVLAMVPPVWGVASVLVTDAFELTVGPPPTGAPLVDRLLVTVWPA